MLDQILNSTSKLVVFSLDTQYRYQYFNSQHATLMRQIWGVEIEKGQSMLGYIKRPDDQAKAKLNFDRALSGEEFTIVEQYGLPDKKRSTYKNNYAPLNDASGSVIGLSVFVTDVTNNISLQKTVDENRLLLSSISTNIQEGIFRTHPELGLTFGNQALANIFGYDDLNELLSTKGEHLYHDKKVRAALTEKAHSQGKFFNEQIRFQRKDGSLFWGLMSAQKVITKDGETYFDGAITDITKYIEAQEKLKENKERLKRAQEIGKMGDWELDLLTREVKWSEGTYKLFGLSQDQLPLTIDEYNKIIDKEILDQLASQVNQAIQNQESFQFEFPGRRFDASLRYFNTIGKPIVKNGCVIKLIGVIQDITDLEQANATRKQSDELLQKIIDALPEFLFIKDAGGFIIFANQEYAKFCGANSYQEIIGKHNSETNYGKNHYDQIKEEDDWVIEHQRPLFNPEKLFVQRDGTKRYMQVTKLPLELAGNNQFVLVLAQDITLRKKAEIELENSKALIENVNHNVNEAIYRSVSGEGLIYVNAAFVKMFRYNSKEELLQIDPQQLYVNPFDRKKYSKILKEKRHIHSQEVQFKRKDGTTFWGYVNATMTKDANGSMNTDGTIRDLTEKKQIEEDLAYKARFQRLLIRIANKHINVPIEEAIEIIENSLTEISYFVEACCAYVIGLKDQQQQQNELQRIRWSDDDCTNCFTILNYVSDYQQIASVNLIGKNFYVENVEGMPPCLLKERLEANNTQTFLSIPMMNDDQCIGAVVFERRKQSSPFKANDIKLLGVFSSMLVNINERIVRQKERKKFIKELQNQNNRLKEYSFIISHNIRSSVSRIKALGQFLLDDRDNQDYLEKLLFSVQNLDETIKNINNLLHLEKMQKKDEIKAYNLIKAIHRIIADIKEQDKKGKQAIFDINLDNCPEQIITVPAYVDSIIYNLISNAVKYGITSISQKIQIVVTLQHEACELIVRDFGIGMDLEKHGSKLFELGGRLHNNSQGQGLGLYMTKRQIQALGGFIVVESKPYKGTKFSVRLPINYDRVNRNQR